MQCVCVNDFTLVPASVQEAKEHSPLSARLKLLLTTRSVQHVTGMCLSCRQPHAAVSMLQTAAQGKSPARPAAARRGVSEVLICLPCVRLLPHMATIRHLKAPGCAAGLQDLISTVL